MNVRNRGPRDVGYPSSCARGPDLGPRSARAGILLALLFGIGLSVVPSLGRADDVRPVQVQIREVEPGRFAVQWQVPQVIPPQAAPTPRLPSGCGPDGEPAVREQPGAWLTLQFFRCEGPLSGERIHVDYPLGNPSLSTVVKVELLSGERFATMLSPGENAWQVPEAPRLDAPLHAAQESTLAGMRHPFEWWVDLAFLVTIVASGSLLLVTTFGVGQLGGAGLAALGLALPMALGELLLGLAAILLARGVLRSSEDRRSFAPLATGAGVVHGMAWAAASGGSLSALLGVVGMDAVLLTLGFLGVMAGRPGSHRPDAFAYAGGACAVALGLGIWTDSATPRIQERPLIQPLPGAVAGTGTGTQRASQRMSPTVPDAPVQSFLAIEAFEVRNEMLVRLRDVTGAVGLGDVDTLGLLRQPAVKGAVRDLVVERLDLRVDDDSASFAVDRVDFLSVDPTGVLPRTDPVPEAVDEAYVGVTVSVVTASTAGRVVLEWDGFDLAPTLPVTVTDPEISRAAMLEPGDPTLEWRNELSEDPVPRVTATRVEPARLPVPLLSIPLVLVALLLAIRAARSRALPRSSADADDPSSSRRTDRRRSPVGPDRPSESAGTEGLRSSTNPTRWPWSAPARVTLVLGLLLAPIGDVAVAIPSTGTPSTSEARRILGGVLPNVYRAFEFREEAAAYDRLALSITGPTLTEIYLEHRRALEMEERGGARARVEAVEIQDVPSLRPSEAGGFDARAVWTVSGTVTHFGHRHFRQNRYDARVAVVPDADAWKIRSIDVLEEARVQ